MNDAPTPWADFGLSTNARGVPYANVDNAHRVLQKHPYYQGRIWFDSFHNRICTDIDLDGKERFWSDPDDIELVRWMQRTMMMPGMGLAQVQQAVLLIANDDVRRAPRVWLRSLQWDNYKRLDGLATLGYGAEDSDYSMAVGGNLVKSMVARIEHEGAKVDNVVVLEGDQGGGKSTSLAILADPWAGVLHSEMGSKDAVLETVGKILLELPELEGANKREAETIKAFVSRTKDTIRTPYGRHAIDIPRGCIFCGTTNEFSYLRDSTGARRFWPLRCGRINLEWIREHRDQLFAEAYVRVVQNKEAWWEVPIDEARREQDARYEGDPWTQPIDEYLFGRDTTTMAAVLNEALKLDVARQGKREQMRAAVIMRRLGWDKDQDGADRHRCWVRKDEGGSGGSQVVRLIPIVNQRSEPPEPLEQH